MENDEIDHKINCISIVAPPVKGKTTILKNIIVSYIEDFDETYIYYNNNCNEYDDFKSACTIKKLPNSISLNKRYLLIIDDEYLSSRIYERYLSFSNCLIVTSRHVSFQKSDFDDSHKYITYEFNKLSSANKVYTSICWKIDKFINRVYKSF